MAVVYAQVSGMPDANIVAGAGGAGLWKGPAIAGVSGGPSLMDASVFNSVMAMNPQTLDSKIRVHSPGAAAFNSFTCGPGPTIRTSEAEVLRAPSSRFRVGNGKPLMDPWLAGREDLSCYQTMPQPDGRKEPKSEAWSNSAPLAPSAATDRGFAVDPSKSQWTVPTTSGNLSLPPNPAPEYSWNPSCSQLNATSEGAQRLHTRHTRYYS